MTQTLIKNLRRGRLFRLTNDLNAPLLLRSEYDRKEKQYTCYFIDSIGGKCCSYIFVKSETPVWIR